MNFRLLPLIAVLLAMLVRPVSAQENVRFKRFSIEDGLSQSSVAAIVQDHSGFLWIATEDGLNRYDGYNFKKYRNDPDDPGSLSNSNIWCLLVDRDGHLWAGTYSQGLNRYDPRTETFTRFVHDPADPFSVSSNRIRSISEDHRGYIWIGTSDGGLNRLEPGTRRFLRWKSDPDTENSLPSDNIRFVNAVSPDTLWIATNQGLSRYEVTKGDFTNFRNEPGDPGSLGNDSVRHILTDRTGMLWLSTKGGLTRFDPGTLDFENFVHDPADPASLSTNNTRNTFEDRQGLLWISTNRGGLNCFDPQTETFRSYTFDQSDPGSLSNNSPHAIFQDQSGMLWVGTWGGGLCAYDQSIQRFRHFRHDAEDSNSLSSPIIWTIAEGPDSDLWFGLNSGWLDRYDRKTGLYEHVSYGSPVRSNSVRQSYIRNLFWDKEGLLWMGHGNGDVVTYNPGNGSFRTISYLKDNHNPNANNPIRTIYQDRSGSMWFGNSKGGLYHHDRATEVVTNFRHRPEDPGSLSHNLVISLLQDSDGIYWVATSNGLNRLAFDGEAARTISPAGPQPKITRYYHDPGDPQSLSNSYVLSIHEAGNGDLWFGTMLGLSRLRKNDRENPVFTRYFMKNGLPSDVVYGILEDSGGRLWLSTNFGLSCFDPVTETFRNYDTRDGLLVNEYNTGAYTSTAGGTFVFGGVNGANEFHPDRIVDSPFVAPVVLTGFNIFEKPVALEKSIAYLEEITLSYRDNYFSFEFASLDFTTPDRNRYAYMLEGLDKDWTQAGTRHFAGYTHVDPGQYTFMVKGTNGDGVWNEQCASIRLVITPPFWKTWWFITCLLLAIGGGVAFLITLRVRQLLAIERLRSKIAADLHDDIGAGLTEISIMGEIITRKLPAESRQLILAESSRIGTTARGLISSMSDIVWLVSPQRDSLYDLVSRLSDSFKESLESRDVQFKTEKLSHLKSTRLKMEHRQHLLLIFKEAINNSLKYSECSEMALEVGLAGKKLTVRLTDDGKGFDTQAETTGNGLHNMNDRARRMGGTVTIHSVVERGTVVEYSGSIS